jgi:tetratricopeptide (TPR) repeat protein
MKWVFPVAVWWLLAVSVGHAQFDLVDLEFSRDGQYLAALNARGSLTVFDTKTRMVVFQLESELYGTSVAWKPDANVLAVSADRGEGADIWLLDPHKGFVQRVTTHPAQDVSPQWIEGGRSLVFVSCRQEGTDLFQIALETGEPAQPFVQRPFDQWEPCARLDGTAVAYRSLENGKPEIWVKMAGKEPLRVGETGVPPLNAEASQLSWDAASGALLYVERDENKTMLHGFNPKTGKDLTLLTRLNLLSAQYMPESGRLYLTTERALLCQTREKLLSADSPEGIEPVELAGLHLGQVALGTRDGQPLWAALCEGRCVAFREGDLSPGFLTPDLESALLLAEHLYAQGQSQQAEALYTRLGSQLTVPQEIVVMRRHHAAFLRRQGLIIPALTELNRLADAEPPIANSLEITELQGAILLYELRDFTEARHLFTNLAAVASKDAWDTEGWALALTFLDQYQKTLAPAFVDAHAALRRRNGDAALKAMNVLVKRAPENLSVRNAILDLLNDPYEGESVDVLPNPLTSGANAARALELLDTLEARDRKPLAQETASTSVSQPRSPRPRSSRKKKTPDHSAAEREVASRIRQKILEIQLDTKQYEKAIQTTLRVLQADGSQAIGLEDVLGQYLDVPNMDQPLQKSLSRVLLDERVLERLRKMFDDSPEILLQLHLAQAKKLLLEEAVDPVGRLLATLGDQIRTFPLGRFNADVARNQRQYYLFCGKYMEQSKRWESAAQYYKIASQLTADYSPEDADLAGGLLAARAEAELAQTLATDATTLKRIEDIKILLRNLGDPLLAPGAPVEQQRAGAQKLLQMFSETTPSPLDPFLLYHAGFCLARSEWPHPAYYYFDRALKSDPPPLLRAAILFEKVRLFRLGDQHWEQYNTLSNLEPLVELESAREALRYLSARTLLRLGRSKDAAQSLRQLTTTAKSQELRGLAALELEHVEASESEAPVSEPGLEN